MRLPHQSSILFASASASRFLSIGTCQNRKCNPPRRHMSSRQLPRGPPSAYHSEPPAARSVGCHHPRSIPRPTWDKAWQRYSESERILISCRVMSPWQIPLMASLAWDRASISARELVCGHEGLSRPLELNREPGPKKTPMRREPEAGDCHDRRRQLRPPVTSYLVNRECSGVQNLHLADLLLCRLSD